MQHCAFDSYKKLIFSENAVKQKNYTCIECGQTVRLRKGAYRQAHFYHLQQEINCRLNGKGMPHLRVQHLLKMTLPFEEAEIECRFPSISRIADVAWHLQKIIFEIQCSLISQEEVLKRNRDYESMGYAVIWIFHDDRFNQEVISPAEECLKGQLFYFTNMTSEGDGHIYDQFSVLKEGLRIHRLPAFPIDPSQPFLFREMEKTKGIYNPLSKIIQVIADKRGRGFWGDFIHHCMTTKDPDLLSLIKGLSEIDDELLFPYIKKLSYRLINQFFIYPYRALFKVILENACK